MQSACADVLLFLSLLLPYLGYEFEHEFQYKRDVSIWKIQVTEGCSGRVRQTNNVLSSGGYPSYFQNLIHLNKFAKVQER